MSGFLAGLWDFLKWYLPMLAIYYVIGSLIYFAAALGKWYFDKGGVSHDRNIGLVSLAAALVCFLGNWLVRRHARTKE